MSESDHAHFCVFSPRMPVWGYSFFGKVLPMVCKTYVRAPIVIFIVSTILFVIITTINTIIIVLVITTRGV